MTPDEVKEILEEAKTARTSNFLFCEPVIQLCEAYFESIETLNWYANWDWSDKYVQAVPKRAREFLKKHEVSYE